MIEIGTGAPQVIVEATHRPDAAPAIDPFMQSLLRAAGRTAEVEMGPLEEVSPRLARITRPSLSRDYVGLDCGHVARRPLDKFMPAMALCFACPKGLPPTMRSPTPWSARARMRGSSASYVTRWRRPRGVGSC